MEISDTVTVSAPPERVWPTLLDIERVAPCLPGAQLTDVDGDDYTGTVTVKLGPVTTAYRGVASMREVDEAGMRLVISAKGRETRGQGQASANVTVELRPEGDGTRVSIDTDLTVSGRVAQFGRGVMEDVSARLLAQFAQNLEELWATPSTPADSSDSQASPAPSSASSTRERAAAEPVDLVAVGGGAVARRLVPVLVIGVVLIVCWRVVRHRRRSAP
ncbi:MAG: SRPBCC family protein [Acidimicrobiia bacterium]|nr:SRPBCC family protein [Acidimicrobiia bacterium]